MTKKVRRIRTEAQLFNENVLIAEWEETVTVAYTEHRIEKGVRDPNFPSNSRSIEWALKVNYGQSVLTLYMLSINWLFVVLGLLTKSIETASAFTFPMLFLPYLSSAFVPTETMPTWLHAFAEHQPMTPLIETLRGQLIGTPIENNLWLSAVWFGGLLIVSVAVASCNRSSRWYGHSDIQTASNTWGNRYSHRYKVDNGKIFIKIDDGK